MANSVFLSPNAFTNNGSVIAPALPIGLQDGTAAAPSLVWASDPTTGWFKSSTGEWSWSRIGSNSIRLRSADITILNDSGAFIFGSGQDSNVSRTGAAALAIGNGTAGDFSGTLKLATLNGTTKIQNNGVLLISATAPTVTSAGSSPSVTQSNGSTTFQVNVGTGGTATTIVMAMPTAPNGWNAVCDNLTAAAANRAAGTMVVQSSTVNSLTVQYQTISTGIALAFTASDIVSFICFPF